MISAHVVADSVSVYTGARLTTLELVAPKRIVAQFNTHGMIARDSASIRAVPTKKIMAQVESEPYLPPQWNYRQSGMQPAGLMSKKDAYQMRRLERGLRKAVLRYVGKMEELRPSKEDVNAYLEPWMYTTIVATATEWGNYFRQRLHGDTQAAHTMLAMAMRAALDNSQPVERSLSGSPDAQWHLPYITDDERRELPPEVLPPLSARRCAAVSYFRQGTVGVLAEDLAKARDLVVKGHWSPLEMPSMVVAENEFHGKYRGWKPLRKMFAGESGSKHHGTQVRDERWSRW